ncbi:hypothetical protein KIN20_029111 [Parelaphostrongylus tenuis]|uniref:Uncharacterized protein n=1 Tax=Parelaphostrongylus tenuis TaxID=148309 RepID=A0AAD5R1W2_PARTN|nr:hypothetical protein KIN20_029111 [Parelaphostrongylus tenuis]
MFSTAERSSTQRVCSCNDISSLKSSDYKESLIPILEAANGLTSTLRCAYAVCDGDENPDDPTMKFTFKCRSS